MQLFFSDYYHKEIRTDNLPWNRHWTQKWSEQNSMSSDYFRNINSSDFNSHCFLGLSFPSGTLRKFIPLFASLGDLLKQSTKHTLVLAYIGKLSSMTSRYVTCLYKMAERTVGQNSLYFFHFSDIFGQKIFDRNTFFPSKWFWTSVVL